MILKKWFGASRMTYNMCLNAINNKKASVTKKDLRNKCVNSTAIVNYPFLSDVPYDVRDSAMIDLVNGIKTNLKKGGKFTMKFRSKKDKVQSLSVRHKHFDTYGTYGFIKDMRYCEKLPPIQCDFRIINDSLNKYWICIPTIETCVENQDTNKIVSLDPGVRTFMCGYDPSGIVFEYGRGDISRIYRLCYKYDKYQSLMSKKPKRERQSLSKAMKFITNKIRNLVKEAHYKLANYLCRNYSVILIPEFETQSMIKKKKRQISSKTARAMMTWSHYTFRTRLTEKSREYPNTKIIIVGEEYTSKTCGNCGEQNMNLGASKEFHCKKCSLDIDRDINGARNIFLKFLNKTRVTL